MERYTIEQRVKVIQAYYENGRSNQNAYRVLVGSIGKIVLKFGANRVFRRCENTCACSYSSTAENIADVRDSIAEEPFTSTRLRAQQLHLSRQPLMNIMHKDLHLHAYKVQLTQELKPLDHSKFHSNSMAVLSHVVAMTIGR